MTREHDSEVMTDEVLQKIFDKACLVAESLGSAASILREMKESLPTPVLEELQDMVMGNRPPTSEAVLFVVLHETIQGVEKMVENLRQITPETLSMILSGFNELGERELNDLRMAVAERQSSR